VVTARKADANFYSSGIRNQKLNYGTWMCRDLISPALKAINAETVTAFDWLAAKIDRRKPVTFVPNPGNLGDAAINLACFDYLRSRFDTVTICGIAETPQTECVFVGGGGNAVQPFYVAVRDFLDRLGPDHRLYMFPATIKGYAKSLRRVAPIARILCRESTSLAYVARQIGSEKVSLAHDAAFLLAPRLRNAFADRIEKAATAKFRSFRTDRESIHWKLGGNDIMAEHHSNWTNMAAARDLVWTVANYLLEFDEVETDRLHCAILAAILGRRTILRANSYYKNAAVFSHSLSRLSNTEFVPSKIKHRIRHYLSLSRLRYRSHPFSASSSKSMP
jgi:exopolysaccharide biosynthesis predicted pyruvyltransferase EpsI